MNKTNTLNEPNDKPLDFSLVLASSVHDMKNSLGMLLNTLEQVIADNPAQNEEQAQRFACLQYESSRINVELVQLLSIYRMQNDRMPIHIEEHYVVETLEEQLARNHMLFETRSIKVRIDCDEDLKGYFDAELVGGVVHNILVNCARYSREKLSIVASCSSGGLSIAVCDDGGGYPPSMLAAPSTTNAGVSFSSGSTNLGLFFAFKVAELHCINGVCGRIELANNGPLGGGVFTIHLP